MFLALLDLVLIAEGSGFQINDFQPQPKPRSGLEHRICDNVSVSLGYCSVYKGCNEMDFVRDA